MVEHQKEVSSLIEVIIEKVFRNRSREEILELYDFYNQQSEAV